MSASSADAQRLHDLLAARATQRLSPRESRELHRLLAAHPEADELAFERAAAAAELVFLGGEAEPMPGYVREALKARAAAWLRGRGA